MLRNNMNYELAKELKEAGFPQQVMEVGDRIIYETERKLWDMSLGIVNEVEGIREPTLSELIGACGWKIQMLWQTTDTGDGGVMWYAGTVFDPKLAYGSTPEEAVARLWLALNKK